MALIPLKDTVTITPANGGLDDWGNPIPGTPVTYKCRIDEETRLTRNQNGQEVVSNTQILLDKAVAVSYDDDVTWTDSAGVTRTRKPIRIGTIKDIASKVLFTEVEV